MLKMIEQICFSAVKDNLLNVLKLEDSEDNLVLTLTRT